MILRLAKKIILISNNPISTVSGLRLFVETAYAKSTAKNSIEWVGSDFAKSAGMFVYVRASGIADAAIPFMS